jgi:hypothetical protein
VISGEAVRLPARVLVEIPEAERPDSSDPSVIGTERVHGWTEKSDSESYTQVVANWRKTTVRTES